MGSRVGPGNQADTGCLKAAFLRPAALAGRFSLREIPDMDLGRTVYPSWQGGCARAFSST